MQLSESKHNTSRNCSRWPPAIEIDNANRMRKQELMFAILKKKAKAAANLRDGTLRCC